MTDKTVAEQVAEGVERALAHAHPEQRLRVRQGEMTDRVRAEAARKRTEREQSIRARLFDRPLRELQRERERNGS